MLLSQNLIKETHYEVLSVREDASHEEIRTNYRSAILNSHPDKTACSSEAATPDGDMKSREKFLSIQKAWETLGDPKSRAIYDNELRSSRADSSTADEVDMEDMTVEDCGESLVLYRQCRCGDYFSVDSFELSNNDWVLTKVGLEVHIQTPDSSPALVVLPCGSCSLRIRLLIDSNTTVPLYF